MSTSRRTLSIGPLRAHLRAGAFRSGPADLVGVEVELTPVATFAGRIDTEAANSGVEALMTEALVGRDRAGPYWRAGVLSREPGGQLEYSGLAVETPEAAARQTARAVRGLKALARRRGFDLVAVGFHPWASAEAIGLRTQAARYRSMQAYFDEIGPWGRRMMRQTGSIQVNVDFGGPEEWADRWELAQRLSPILAAMFANSGVEGGRPATSVGLRGEAWLRLDPSRTGIPSRFLEGSDEDPVDQYLSFALAARVMSIAGADGTMDVPAYPISFAGWMVEGMLGGYPDIEDWKAHLGTLFPDVRAKGYLELRAMDAPGYAWLAIPTLLSGHALREPAVRRAMLGELRPLHDELESMRGRAARWGLADPGLRGAAEHLIELVRPCLDDSGRRIVDAYAERYVRLGRSPGDELRRGIGPGEMLEPEELIRLEKCRLAGVGGRRGVAAVGG